MIVLEQVIKVEELVAAVWSSFSFFHGIGCLNTFLPDFLASSSYPRHKVGVGFAVEGIPSAKCIEHTLSLPIGCHNVLFINSLLKALIHNCLSFFFCFIAGNLYNKNGISHYEHSFLFTFCSCSLQTSFFHLFNLYVLFIQPITAQLTLGIFI